MTNTSPMLSITAEILGLKNVEVTKVELNNANEFIITVVSTKKEMPCHKCGRPTEPHGKGQTVRLRHLPIFGKKSFIQITPPRSRPHCEDHPTSTQLAD